MDSDVLLRAVAVIDDCIEVDVVCDDVVDVSDDDGNPVLKKMGSRWALRILH